MRFGLEKALASLLLLTVVAIIGERKILETQLILDSRSGYTSHYSDPESSAEILDSERMEWVCHLRAGYNWTSCGFELILSPDRQKGLDLRNYDRIRIWLDYEGPTETIRFYLRNYDPAYSQPDKNSSTKYNQIEFDSDLARFQPSMEFDLGNFFVADWWLQGVRLAPELTFPQLDNIVIIEVQSGVDFSPGEHRFQLNKIELTGQALTTAQWYQLIVGVWLAFALILLTVRIVKLKTELERRSARAKELIEINSLLDSRGRELEAQARIDPLTGAFNRQGLEEAMTLALSEWRQEGKPFSIVMLDLDHFKYINDTYGHAEGDRVLSGVSTLIKDHIRATDVFARWGGEEFVLVCRNTALHEAMIVAEKLRKSVQQQTVGEENKTLSASFGVATIQSGETLDQIFNRVDKALYEAKNSGRNRVELSRNAA